MARTPPWRLCRNATNQLDVRLSEQRSICFNSNYTKQLLRLGLRRRLEVDSYSVFPAEAGIQAVVEPGTKMNLYAAFAGMTNPASAEGRDFNIDRADIKNQECPDFIWRMIKSK